MVALLVFILAYNGDLAGKKNDDGRGPFGGNVFKAPTEKPLAPRVDRFPLLEMF